MNQYIFHINLYDLISLGTIFIGLTFALLLCFSRGINRTANRLLGLTLAAIALWMVWVLGIDMRLATYFPQWSWLPLRSSLIIGPLIYFYVLKMTRPEHIFRRKDLLHFSPFLLEQGALIAEVKESIRTGAATYDTFTFRQISPVLYFATFISVIAYLYLSFKLIERFYKGLKFNALNDRHRHEMRWLHRLLTGFGLLWLLWIPNTAVNYFYYHDGLGLQTYYPLYLLLFVMTIWIAAASFLKTGTGAPGPAFQVSKPSPSWALRQKGIWLKKAMETGLYYSDAELSLSSLAEKLDLSPHELSRIINVAVKKSFNDFINEYRVADVVRKMHDPAYNRLTLLGIGYDSGFNSNSSFHRIFKDKTGKSPAEYKADLKKDLPSYNLGQYPRFPAIFSSQETTPKWYPEKSDRKFMIKNFISSAVTNMERNKIYTLINVCGLSIGLACVMLITLYIKDELSFDRFNVNSPRMYRLVIDGRRPDGSDMHQSFTGALQAQAFKEQIPGILSICRVNGGGESLVRKGNELISEPMLYADKSFFQMFTFPLVQGDPGTALADPKSIVISEDIAKKYFGDENAIGKIFEIAENGRFQPFVVSAVAKNPPMNSTIRFKFLRSIEPQMPKSFTAGDWFNSFLTSFICLRADADEKRIEKQMAQVFNHDVERSQEYVSLKKSFPKFSQGFHLEPFLDVHLSKIYDTGNGLQPSSKANYSFILGGIALFILFIACINFINLSLSRAMRRSKEIGIRKVIGSSRKQLIIQFLGESFILSLIGSWLAIVIVIACLPEFNKLSGKELQIAYLVNGQTIAIFILILLGNTLLSGFYPALVLSGFKPVETLYGKLKFSGQNYFGKSLVVLQFVVAIFLVIGTLVMQKQFSYLINFDLGYKPQNIIDLTLPQHKNPNYAVFKNSLLKYPFIKQVSGQVVSFTSGYGTLYKSGDKDIQSSFFDVDNDFLSEMNIRLVRGHGFKYAAGDTTECLVNQAFIKAAGWHGNPIGHIIMRGQEKKPLTVIGVTADFHSTSLNSAIGPVVLDQTAKASYGDVMIKIGNDQKEKAITAIQAEYKKIIPDYPCTYNFLTDELAQQYESTNRWKQIITASSIMSILISCLGLFGLATLAIEKRIKEISIRKVLGASVGQISSVLTINFLKLVFISIIIAAPLAWYAMDKWLQDYPYRISINVWIIVTAGAGSLLIAIVTIGAQAIRAALANPVKHLRRE